MKDEDDGEMDRFTSSRSPKHTCARASLISLSFLLSRIVLRISVIHMAAATPSEVLKHPHCLSTSLSKPQPHSSVTMSHPRPQSEDQSPSLRAKVDEEESIRRNNDENLKSLLRPWALLALIALVAAATQSAEDEQQEPWMETEDSSFPSYLPRFLQRAQQHKPLLPLDANDYIGFACATIGLMIAAGGGIGGGGILVPTYILVMGFTAKEAIPLSNVTVFGGAIANTLLNVRKRHPLADRPLIDWDLILVMEPLTIAGALIGAFLNKLLNETLLVVMLVALLSFTAYASLKKAIKMYKIETRHMRTIQNEHGTKASELTKIVHDDEEDDEDEAKEVLLENMELQEGENPGDGVMTDVDMACEELKVILEEERVTPMTNIKILSVMFVVVLFINLIKGGGAFRSPLGIRCGSTSFWMANALMFGWILLISFIARSYLVERFHLKERAGYKYVEGDIQWDARATIAYPAICCLAGFFAGMFGIGGGIVKGPLMLAMGVHPAVSSASSACMILFTSFTATTSFVVFGLLIWDYSIVCLCIGFLATIVGQVGLSYLMKKYQRNSYIAFSIGGVVLLSALLMTIQSLVSMAEHKHHHSGGICGKGD